MPHRLDPVRVGNNFKSRSNSTVSDAIGGSEHTQLEQHQQSSGGVAASADGGGQFHSSSSPSITAEALDVATANFDESFQRMPIETEDYEKQQQAAGHPPISEQELNDQTFRGFTFDGDIDLLPESNSSPGSGGGRGVV